MTNPTHDAHDAHDTDPVDEFFARQRADVPTLVADELHWQRVLSRTRRSRGRRWMRYAAGAAAAVIAGTVGWQVVGRGASPGPETPPVTITTAQPSPDRSPATRRSTPPTVTSTPPTAVPVPASFRVQSVSTAADRTLFALGTVTCPGGALCPALATSRDDGSTWRQVHVFTGAGVLPPGQTGRPGGTGVLSQVRFANTSVGWVYGGDVLRTTDGGATWQDYPHGGGDVIDLATDGTDVVLTTADRCSGGTCSGTLRVLRAPITATSVTDIAGSLGRSLTITAAPVSWHRGHAYVSPATVPPTGVAAAGPVVLRADGLHAAGPAGCGHGQGPTQLVAPATGTTLFAVCPTSGAAGHLGYAVHASSDAGATWRLVSSDALVLVNAGSAAFAAADAGTLLAVSGGGPDLHGSMELSVTGGEHWQTPRTAPPLPNRGWAWVGAPGGPTFYAVAADPSSGYWKSTNRGETWVPLTVAGR